MKLFVSTHPFSSTSDIPMKLIEENNIELSVNKHKRKITTQELVQDIKDAEVLVAGTEKITEEVLRNAPNLKLISRVGIGLDGINFNLCKKYGIRVTYTPDAPTMAVAELCVGMILDLARKITYIDKHIKSGIWHRYMGTLLYDKTVGIFGMGRIGKSLIHLLQPFNVNFLVHDIEPDFAFGRLYNVKFVSKNKLLQQSDIVSINLPLKEDTKNYISITELKKMKRDAFIINTARGGIINEDDLYFALKEGIINSAGIDVFEVEPYKGRLIELENCLLSCHMGASTIDSRTDMEVQAIEEAIRYKNTEPLKNEVFKNA